jgi:putative transposase
MIETFFKSLEAELFWQKNWRTRRQAEAATIQHINSFYNTRICPSYIGGLAARVRSKSGHIKIG